MNLVTTNQQSGVILESKMLYLQSDIDRMRAKNPRVFFKQEK